MDQQNILTHGWMEENNKILKNTKYTSIGPCEAERRKKWRLFLSYIRAHEAPSSNLKDQVRELKRAVEPP